jgi:cytochrome c peroxidase
MRHAGLATRILAVALAFLGVVAAGGRHLPGLGAYPNPSGEARTLAPGPIETSGPFFEPLGNNGRSCATCHLPSDGWSLTPATAQRLFEATDGRHPLFRRNDGANAPTLPDTTVAERRAAYSLLLGRGLVRVGHAIPSGADFVLDGVDDPYGFASAAELSLFRRPLPSTNLAFLSTVMWDGRRSRESGSIHEALVEQANGAATGHAQGLPLTDAQRGAIVAFETGLVTSQSRDERAGDLHVSGGRGGPQALAEQPFFAGINSSRAPGGFNRRVFSLFGDWARAAGELAIARQAVARGETVFNERAFAGGNFTCTTCHNAPNVGSNSIAAMFDLGIAAETRRTPDVPLYTLRCVRGGRAVAAGRIVRTTDPGLALVTGRCDDIGRFKVPTLRGLAARAPYFHDGSARTLEEVLAFYDQRFAIKLTPDERGDLLAFLRVL